MNYYGWKTKCPKCGHPMNAHHKKDYTHGRMDNTNCRHIHCMCVYTQIMIEAEVNAKPY